MMTGRDFVKGALIAFAIVNSWFIYTSVIPGSQPTPPFASSPNLPSDFDDPKNFPPSNPGENMKSATTNSSNISSVKNNNTKECDIFVGRWVRDAKPPLYTNETCKYIQPSQNCMMNGRPDRKYLNWKWKPSTCELANLDPVKFLEFMRNKKMLFIGDSLARNHMQSLLCALAQVEEPKKLYFDTKDKEMRWGFTSYNFTLNQLWSPFFTHHEVIDGLYHIHVDVPENVWESQVHDYDIAILSSGYWFFRPSVYYMNKTMLGCNPASQAQLNCTVFDILPAYRLIHQNMLRHMIKSFKGITMLRTITVDHFEYGSWNTGGLCNRTEPYSATDPPELPWMTQEMNAIQVEEVKKAVKAGGADSWRLKLLNISWSAFMRPDGHPNGYRVQPAFETPQNDCLHWCLPGPIDTWNQFLWHTLSQVEFKDIRTEGRSSRLRKLGTR